MESKLERVLVIGLLVFSFGVVQAKVNVDRSDNAAHYAALGRAAEAPSPVRLLSDARRSDQVVLVKYRHGKVVKIDTSSPVQAKGSMLTAASDSFQTSQYVSIRGQ